METLHRKGSCLLVLGRALGIPGEENGASELFRELLLRPQEPGHEEVKERVELENIVLNRCPAENEAMTRLELFDSQRDLKSEVRQGWLRALGVVSTSTSHSHS